MDWESVYLHTGFCLFKTKKEKAVFSCARGRLKLLSFAGIIQIKRCLVMCGQSCVLILCSFLLCSSGHNAEGWVLCSGRGPAGEIQGWKTGVSLGSGQRFGRIWTQRWWSPLPCRGKMRVWAGAHLHQAVFRVKTEFRPLPLHPSSSSYSCMVAMTSKDTLKASQRCYQPDFMQNTRV